MLGRALPKSKTPTFELIEKLLYDSNVVALELKELGAGFTMVQKSSHTSASIKPGQRLGTI